MTTTDSPPAQGGSYMRDEASGDLTPLFVPLDPEPAVFVEPDPIDKTVVEVLPPTEGGSYSADDATGDLTAVFVPGQGMTPDIVAEPEPLAEIEMFSEPKHDFPAKDLPAHDVLVLSDIPSWGGAKDELTTTETPATWTGAADTKEQI